MNMKRNCIGAALALSLAVTLPALADSYKDPVSTSTRETTTTSQDANGMTSSSTTTTEKHKYVYYADHDIYFAPDTKTYYYQANGNWTSGTTLPPAAPLRFQIPAPLNLTESGTFSLSPDGRYLAFGNPNSDNGTDQIVPGFTRFPLSNFVLVK